MKNTSISVGLLNTPKKSMTNNGVVIRYGFQEIPGTGFAKYIEHVFPVMPDEETLKEIVEKYNTENNINSVFNISEYQ